MLPSGQKLLVPVSPTISVSHLRESVIRRASAIGEHNLTLQNTVLQTTGSNYAYLSDEDPLAAVIDATENKTFSLQRVKEHRPNVSSHIYTIFSLS